MIIIRSINIYTRVAAVKPQVVQCARTVQWSAGPLKPRVHKFMQFEQKYLQIIIEDEACLVAGPCWPSSPVLNIIIPLAYFNS